MGILDEVDNSIHDLLQERLHLLMATLTRGGNGH